MFETYRLDFHRSVFETWDSPRQQTIKGLQPLVLAALVDLGAVIDDAEMEVR